VKRSVYPSPIKNLFIAPDFAQEQILRSFELFRSSFDVILVYLPQNTSPAIYETLLKYADVKMLF